MGVVGGLTADERGGVSTAAFRGRAANPNPAASRRRPSTVSAMRRCGFARSSAANDGVESGRKQGETTQARRGRLCAAPVFIVAAQGQTAGKIHVMPLSPGMTNCSADGFGRRLAPDGQGGNSWKISRLGQERRIFPLGSARRFNLSKNATSVDQNHRQIKAPISTLTAMPRKLEEKPSRRLKSGLGRLAFDSSKYRRKDFTAGEGADAHSPHSLFLCFF